MNTRDNRPEKKQRADMYAPWWMPVLGVAIAVLGLALIIHTYMDAGTLNLASIIFILFIPMGGYLVLAWKNETIQMLPEEDAFVYNTAFGRSTVYPFSDIEDIRTRNGSFTLMLKDGKKISIDSMSVISERFSQRLFQDTDEDMDEETEDMD